MKQMNLFQLLKNDHRLVRSLLSRLEKTKSGLKTRTQLFEKLRDELRKHTKAEEKAIYPSLKGHRATSEIGFESTEEHGVVEYLIEKLNATAVESEEWTALISVLKETVEHHVKEEEGTMFPEMRVAFSTEELKEMALEFLEAKKTLGDKLVELVSSVGRSTEEAA